MIKVSKETTKKVNWDDKGGKGMKLTIEAEPKEIAALVVAIQERREDEQVQLILNRLQEKLHQNESILWL